MTAAPIVLVGMSGAGKTTVGQALARLTGGEFIDQDGWIEAQLDRSITAAIEGSSGPAEVVFASEALCDVFKKTIKNSGRPTVVAIGGLFVLSKLWRDTIVELSQRRVLLEVDAANMIERIRCATPPHRLTAFMAGGTTAEDLAYFERYRRPFYTALATNSVDTNHRTPDEVLREILEVGELDPAGRKGLPPRA